MADQFRTAHDTMGEMQIPVDALWGASTQRAVDNFPVSGQPVPMEVVQAHAMLKWAAGTANEETGVVDAEVADAIRRAADEVIDGQLDEHFPVGVFQTGSGTSTKMNVNEVLANRAKQLLGEELSSTRVHPNDHVNASQSSNDTFPTSVHVAVARVAKYDTIPGALHPPDRPRPNTDPRGPSPQPARSSPTHHRRPPPPPTPWRHSFAPIRTPAASTVRPATARSGFAVQFKLVG